MKKIAFFLAIIMLFTCIVFTSCSEKKAESSIEDEISSEIRYSLMAKIAFYNTKNNKSLTYSDHTISVVTIVEGKEYMVSGTVYALQSGKKLSTDYSGNVEFDASSNEYDCDIEIGNFR